MGTDADIHMHTDNYCEENREIANTLRRLFDLVLVQQGVIVNMPLSSVPTPSGNAGNTNAEQHALNRLSSAIEINQAIVSSVTAIVVADSGEIIGATAPADMMFGYAIGELAGRRISVHDLVPPELRQKHIEHWEMFWKHPRARQMGEAKMRLEGYHLDGTRFPVEVGWGNPIFVLQCRCVVASIMHVPLRDRPDSTIGSLNANVNSVLGS